jgi:hypothetical protein
MAHSTDKYTLSADLKNWRAERPDEWVMDRFIRAASNQEKLIEMQQAEIDRLRALKGVKAI